MALSCSAARPHSCSIRTLGGRHRHGNHYFRFELPECVFDGAVHIISRGPAGSRIPQPRRPASPSACRPSACWKTSAMTAGSKDGHGIPVNRAGASRSRSWPTAWWWGHPGGHPTIGPVVRGHRRRQLQFLVRIAARGAAASRGALVSIREKATPDHRRASPVSASGNPGRAGQARRFGRRCAAARVQRRARGGRLPPISRRPRSCSGPWGISSCSSPTLPPPASRPDRCERWAPQSST